VHSVVTELDRGSGFHQSRTLREVQRRNKARELVASEDSVWAPVRLHAVVVGCSYLVGESVQKSWRGFRSSRTTACASSVDAWSPTLALSAIGRASEPTRGS